MKHLTIDGFVLRFPRTGVVNYAYNIIAELTKRPDFEITVLLEDNNFTDPDIADFAREFLKTRLVDKVEATGGVNKLKEHLRNRKLAARLPNPEEVARAVSPGDIYYSTDWYHYAVPHARYNILMYHDLTAKLYPDFHEYTNIIKEKRKANAARAFDHIIANSDSTKNDLIKYLNIPEHKITTCHLGVDKIYENSSVLSRKVLLEKYNIDRSHRYILSVSTIEPRKNIIGILDTFKIFLSSNPNYRDMRLVLSGQMGWRTETLNQYMMSYPYKDNIIFPGYVSLEDMPSLYHHAEAFIYLSFYEGFGIPILEAMKSSCPVICSNTSSMPEVIGDCGETVSPHSPDEAAAALARILDDTAYADSLRFTGLMRSRKFTWGNHAERLIEIFNNA